MTKLLIIGGGIAGCAAAVGLRKLDKETEIVLVEPKDHCEVAWCSYRSPFDDQVAKDSLLPLAAWAEKHNVQHIRSVVAKLSKTEAILQNGATVPFDVCVVATGADSKARIIGRGLPTGNGNRDTRLNEMKQVGTKVLGAKNVVIVGGGLIGTELAGDIVTYSKQAGSPVSVTLVHSGPTLCHHEISPKAAIMTQKKLVKLGVTIILNERATENDGKLTLQTSGEPLESDEIIYTVGITPINSFLSERFADSLNESGWIETDEFFRFQGSSSKMMFCIGDCSTLLPNAGSQVLNNVQVIGKNLHATIAAIKDGNKASLEDVKLIKAKPEPMKATVVTVGNKDGVFDSSLFHTQFVLPALKNKTMFLFRAKGELGIPK